MAIVSYLGITKQAIMVSLQSDITNASKQIRMYQIEHGYYPSSIDSNNCPASPADDNYCFKTSPGNYYVYNVNNNVEPKVFGITFTNSNYSYRVVNDSSYVACAPGFIIVPGSVTYGTSDFCVMKYEAKQVGVTNVPISKAADQPWANIGQTSAKNNSSGVAGCTGCHLISEPEWMTIAQNVLKVSSNWSGSAVGSGYVFYGHNDSTPNSTIAAGVDDNDGYVNTLNSQGDFSVSQSMTGNSQRRTFTLSNGEVIWDFSGNVWEWVDARFMANQQPGFLTDTDTYAWKQWNDPALLQHGLANSSMPASTGIPNIETWDNTKGIGRLWSNYNETLTKAFRRGGSYLNGTDKASGVLALNLNNVGGDINIGFRVSR